MGTDEITERKREESHEGVGGLVEGGGGGGRRRGEEGSEESEGWVKVKEVEDLWKEEDGGERGEGRGEESKRLDEVLDVIL